jgi:hypothetical protein
MKTKLSHTVMRFFYISVILLWVISLPGWGLGRAAADTRILVALSPHMNVNPIGHWAQGHGWPEGTSIHLAIVRPGTPTYEADAIMGPDPYHPGEIVASFNLWDPRYDLQAGDLVSMSGGGTPISMTVTGIHITGVDPVANTVSGMADAADGDVHIWVDNGPDLIVAVGSGGNWTADFSPYDLTPGMKGWALQEDANYNCTQVDWNLPNPHIEVNPVRHLVTGVYWPLGTSLHMTIMRPATPTFEADAEVVLRSPSDPAYTVAFFSLWNPRYDLQAGDVITISGGDTTRSTKVMALQVTSADGDTNTVSGTADAADGNVHVWVNVNNGPVRDVAVGAGGNWMADFSPYDLTPGMDGGAQQFDSYGNHTDADWKVPNPNIIIWSNEDRVEAYEWPLGHTVTLAIDNPLTGKNPDFTDTRIIGVLPWDPSQTYAEFNLKGLFDIQPGFHVILSDGTTTKAHTVTSVAVTGVDLDKDLVHGMAQANTQVFVTGCYQGCWNRHVTADGNGDWTADFAHPGPLGDEQDTFDIVPGSNGDAKQCDEDGDCTDFSYRVPDPHFFVSVNEDRVEAYEWKLGATVTLAIDNPLTIYQNPDYTATRIIGISPWDPNQTYAEFNLKGLFDIQPGFHVSLSDGATTKAHTVTSLAVTGVDLDKDLVFGVAQANTVTFVRACPRECHGRDATADADGNWTADFGHPAPLPGEPNTVDIVPGLGGDARQCDEDGDCTFFYWSAPPPAIYLPLVFR